MLSRMVSTGFHGCMAQVRSKMASRLIALKMTVEAEILERHPAREWLPKGHSYDHKKILPSLSAEICGYLQYKAPPPDRQRQVQRLLQKLEGRIRASDVFRGYISTSGPLLRVVGSYVNGTASCTSPIDVCVLIITPNSMETVADPKLWFAFSKILLNTGYTLVSTQFYQSIVRTVVVHTELPVALHFYYHGKELMNNTERAIQLFKESPSLQQLHCLIKAICRHKCIHGFTHGNISSHYIFLLIQAFALTLLPKQLTETVGSLLILFTNFISNYDESIYYADVHSGNILCEQKIHRTEPYFEVRSASSYDMHDVPYKYCVFKDTMMEISRLLRHYESPGVAAPISIVFELCGF